MITSIRKCGLKLFIHSQTSTNASLMFWNGLVNLSHTWLLFRAGFDVNTLRPGQNGRHFADDILKCIFVNENVWIPIKISLKFVPKGPINNIPALVQIMARRRPGDKPLSEPMMVRLPTHICVTRPQWVNKMGPWGRWVNVPIPAAFHAVHECVAVILCRWYS